MPAQAHRPTRGHCPGGVQPRPPQPKGVPKARRGDYGHANIKPAIGGYYYGDYMATHNAKAGSQPRLTWARCKLTSWRRTSGARRGRRASNPCITRSKSAGCTLRCRRRRRENVPDRLGRRAGTGKVPMHLTLSVWTFRPLAVGLGSRYSRGSRRVPAPLPALYNRTSPRPAVGPVHAPCGRSRTREHRSCPAAPAAATPPRHMKY